MIHIKASAFGLGIIVTLGYVGKLRQMLWPSAKEMASQIELFFKEKLTVIVNSI